MSLRRRLTLLSALAVALAVAVVSVIVYVLVRDQLRNQIDDTLGERARAATVIVGGQGYRPGQGQIPAPRNQNQAQSGGGGPPPGLPPGGGPPPGQGRGGDSLDLPGPPQGDFVPLGQLINAKGEVVQPPDDQAAAVSGTTEFPVTDEAAKVAAGEHGRFFADVNDGGTELRVLTVPVTDGRAFQVARPLTEVNDTLGNLTLILFLVAAGGAALAAGLGLLVARTSLAPAVAVSRAAREVAENQDLTRRIEVSGHDELASLADSFNQMLAALEVSVGSQRRLVADASHELRTPLATLRTNIDTLRRREDLPVAERNQIMDDLDAELAELGSLVGDVVELAREPSEGNIVRQDIGFDELISEAVDRARRRGRGLRFTENLEPAIISGDPQRIDRAVSNLLDNAIKWSPEGGEVEVTQSGGSITVRDHGPGFSSEGLEHAFERFYRADEARGMPGSGLGLAIVQRIAVEHGGDVRADNAAGGGAAVGIDLPLNDS